ncbi:MAG: GMC family oxidoreductase [Solirubrobacteraceae bacterium]
MSEDRIVDIIVVGAGAAGSVVARRLHDAGARVLVLEAGGSNEDAMIADPQRFFDLVDGPFDWAYRTVPQEHLGGRQLPWAQGHVVGGSSSINGMIWIRGCAEDFDHWAYLGNPGWSYADLLPLLRRIEDFDRGASEVRGAGGPMPVWSEWEPDPIHRSVVEAMQELGIPFNHDHNGHEILGTGYCQYNIRDGRRVSAADAYLMPVAATQGLELLSGAHVRRLCFEGDRCIGVEWQRGGRLERACAHGEVVLTGGVIGSATLLLRSGVGPADELAAHGIEVVSDVPGVGENLHDHVHVPLQFATERPVPASPPGIPPMQTNTFIATDPRMFTPDIQAPSVGALTRYDGIEPLAANGFSVSVTILRTASRGRLRLAGPDPDTPPLIDPATYSAPGDFDSMLAGLRLLRALERTAALSEWGARELSPGAAVDGEDDLADYARRMTFTASHPVGTCKMGVDARAVVDPELCVRGVAQLRVADSSIMPTVISGNTHAASIMIGERASDLLIAAGRAGGAPVSAPGAAGDG